MFKGLLSLLVLSQFAIFAGASFAADGSCSLVCEGQKYACVDDVARTACKTSNAVNLFDTLPRCLYSVTWSDRSCASLDQGSQPRSGTCLLNCEGRQYGCAENVLQSECTARNAGSIFETLPRCLYSVTFSTRTSCR